MKSRSPSEDSVVVSGTTLWFLGKRRKPNDVVFQEDPVDGREVLVWLAEKGTKTRKGQEHGHQRQAISAHSPRNRLREMASATLQDLLE